MKPFPGYIACFHILRWKHDKGSLDEDGVACVLLCWFEREVTCGLAHSALLWLRSVMQVYTKWTPLSGWYLSTWSGLFPLWWKCPWRQVPMMKSDHLGKGNLFSGWFGHIGFEKYMHKCTVLYKTNVLLHILAHLKVILLHPCISLGWPEASLPLSLSLMHYFLKHHDAVC